MDIKYNDNTRRYEVHVSLPRFKTVVSTVGFIAGIVWSIKSMDDVGAKPLSTAWNCAMGGTVASFGATVVSNLSPPITEVLTTITCGASILYYGKKLIA